jgi:hypothetical protein
MLSSFNRKEASRTIVKDDEPQIKDETLGNKNDRLGCCDQLKEENYEVFRLKN